MAMVRHLTEGEIINGNSPEDDSHSSDHLEGSNSRPLSRMSSGSKRASPAFMPSLQYSREDLMQYSSSPLSKSRPSCLDPAYNNSTGKWDPERWFMNHRSDRSLSLDEPRSKRERQDDGGLSHKRKTSDPKERIKDEKDDIVLSPQRRSFGTGCHVIQQSSLARRPGSPVDGRESDNYRDSSRRIGSGRIMSRDRDQRDWERDREYGYGSSRNERRDRFDQDDNEKDIRRYSNRYNRNDRRSRGRERIEEVEPEWFSSGPTSQSETIELVGFEDQQNEDETRKPNKKGSSKRAKQNSRRSSLKSEEGEKLEAPPSEDFNGSKKATLSQEDSKLPEEEVKTDAEVQETKKPATNNFDLDDLFRMEWVPGLLPNESPPENASSDMGCSRFSQWFHRESPLLGMQESTNDSRRSSLHDELIANVLNSIGEPQLLIPSPTHNAADNFFAPISPDLSHSTNYPLTQNMASNSNNKDIMDMLNPSNASEASINGESSKDSAKTVKELEADLKRIVLGEKNQEDRSAFDKLLQHVSDSRNSPATSMSMGPLDKSKVLQEQDILQDILGGSQPPISPMMPFQMYKDERPTSQLGINQSHYIPPPIQPSQNEVFAHILQQKQEQQHLHQMQQHQQLQNHLQQQSQSLNFQGFTVEMLAKILGTSSQQPLSPVSPGLHQPAAAPSLNRNETQVLNSVLQYQRQQREREILSSMFKQQQQQHSASQNLQQANILQQQQQRRCPSTKDIPFQQTLGLPTLGISPRQSPLPPEAPGSTIPNQGRIPSPLVFGQQPPALSHAPAPIHPAALAQAMAQNAANSNTLQVQNPVVLQRVPSPQELAVHTQSILQNALIKRKLEEQKENYRKRQEAQRATSPIPSNKNGTASSPLKGLSPTIAFTPTSVMRKMQCEKAENKEQKSTIQQNGNNKVPCSVEARQIEVNKNIQKANVLGITSSNSDCSFGSVNNTHLSPSQITSSANQLPRTSLGQVLNQTRSVPVHAGMNSVGPSLVIPGQGRPIVKVGVNQSLNSNADIARTGVVTSKPVVTHNKPFLPMTNNQTHNLHDVEPNFDTLAKLQWQHQFNQRQQNNAAIPQLQAATAAYALGHRPPAVNLHPGLMRSVNVASAGNIPTSNINFPVPRNLMQNPTIRANTNPLNHLSQLAALQLRGALDARQIQALAQSQRLHPVALQQLLALTQNTQNQVAAAQAQVSSNFSANSRDNKHLIPGQNSTNRQSPVNLSKWFGNDVLKQKMPEMPPMSHQKALLVEELERQQQSAIVHN